jgi:hypothetical protein
LFTSNILDIQSEDIQKTEWHLINAKHETCEEEEEETCDE